MSLELEVWQAPITDDEGNIQAGAQITVWDAETNESATIFDDLDRSPKSNPFTAGSDGLARFYAEPGRYRIQAQVGSEIAVYDDVDLSQKSHRNDLDSLDPDKGGVLVRRNVIAVDSIADLLALPAAARRSDLRVDVASRNNVSAQPIGGGRYKWDSSSEKRDNGDTVLSVSGVSVGRWIKISGQISEDLEILIPTDYGNWQDAKNDLVKFKACNGAEINLKIESNFEISTPFISVSEDLSHFNISSQDPLVNVAASFPSSENIMLFRYSKAPTLDCLIDANGNGMDGYSLRENSDGRVMPGCGVLNAGNRGLYLNNSSCYANNSVWDGANNRAIWATRTSRLHAEGATGRNAKGNRAVYISRGTTATLSDADFTGFKGINGQGSAVVQVLRSIVFARGIKVSDPDEPSMDGLSVTNGGILVANNAEARNCRIGARCESVSMLQINNADLEGSVDDKIRINSGGHVNAFGVDVDASETDISYFNNITERGVIYHDSEENSLGGNGVVLSDLDKENGYIVYQSGQAKAWRSVSFNGDFTGVISINDTFKISFDRHNAEFGTGMVDTRATPVFSGTGSDDSQIFMSTASVAMHNTNQVRITQSVPENSRDANIQVLLVGEGFFNQLL